MQEKEDKRHWKKTVIRGRGQRGIMKVKTYSPTKTQIRKDKKRGGGKRNELL